MFYKVAHPPPPRPQILTLPVVQVFLYPDLSLVFPILPRMCTHLRTMVRLRRDWAGQTVIWLLCARSPAVCLAVFFFLPKVSELL